MTAFHQPPLSDAAGDPLDRLVEAFVDQSVPDGPDADVQRRMVALLRAADSITPLSKVPVAKMPLRERAAIIESPLRPNRRRTMLQSLVALAAAALLGAVVLPGLRGPRPAPGGEVAIAPAPSEVTQGDPELAATAPGTSQLSLEIGKLLQRYLETHDGRLPDRESAQIMLAEWLSEHPELADSRTWQFAHEQLAAALERPKVLTVGVGLIGAIPWTAYGRF